MESCWHFCSPAACRDSALQFVSYLVSLLSGARLQGRRLLDRSLESPVRPEILTGAKERRVPSYRRTACWGPPPPPFFLREKTLQLEINSVDEESSLIHRYRIHNPVLVTGNQLKSKGFHFIGKELVPSMDPYETKRAGFARRHCYQSATLPHLQY